MASIRKLSTVLPWYTVPGRWSVVPWYTVPGRWSVLYLGTKSRKMVSTTLVQSPGIWSVLPWYTVPGRWPLCRQYDTWWRAPLVTLYPEFCHLFEIKFLWHKKCYTLIKNIYSNSDQHIPLLLLPHKRDSIGASSFLGEQFEQCNFSAQRKKFVFFKENVHIISPITIWASEVLSR